MNHNIITHHAKLIIGLSGGPDSVYLLHQLVNLKEKLNLTLIAAHLDHEWRVESSQDAQFCAQLCESLGIPLIIKKASQLGISSQYDGSREAQGRKLRRAFFEQLVYDYKADAILLGHHRDDQIETFLLRLIRGSSLEGLCAMQEIDGLYRRPLLHTSKQDILTYLEQNNLSFVIDQSNNSDEYLRNRIRKYVLPALGQCDQRFFKKCIDSVQHVQEAWSFTEQVITQMAHNVFVQDDNTKKMWGVLDLTAFMKLHPYAQKTILMKWLINRSITFLPSEAFLQEVLRFLCTKKGGSHALGTSWKIIKKQSYAWINKNQ